MNLKARLNQIEQALSKLQGSGEIPELVICLPGASETAELEKTITRTPGGKPYCIFGKIKFPATATPEERERLKREYDAMEPKEQANEKESAAKT